jgi:hypothetical protein
MNPASNSVENKRMDDEQEKRILHEQEKGILQVKVRTRG